VAKEVVTKMFTYWCGELAVFARQGADVRVHFSESQLRDLRNRIDADLAARDAKAAA
jgi:hypothetical protein